MKMKWIDAEKKMPERRTPFSNMTDCVLVTVTDGGDPYYGEMRSVTEAYFRFDTQRWFNAGSGLIVATVTHWMSKPSPAETD